MAKLDVVYARVPKELKARLALELKAQAVWPPMTMQVFVATLLVEAMDARAAAGAARPAKRTKAVRK